MRVLAELIQRLFVFALPGYRPERHYMRGPGPACARRARDGGEVGA